MSYKLLESVQDKLNSIRDTYDTIDGFVDAIMFEKLKQIPEFDKELIDKFSENCMTTNLWQNGKGKLGEVKLINYHKAIRIIVDYWD